MRFWWLLLTPSFVRYHHQFIPAIIINANIETKKKKTFRFKCDGNWRHSFIFLTIFIATQSWVLKNGQEENQKKMVTYLNYLIDRPTVQPTSSQQANCSSHQFETLFTPNAHRNYDKFHFELFSVLHVSLARMCTCIFFFSRSIVTPRYECMYFMQQHDGDGMCRLSWEIQRASIIISAVAGCICEWSIYYSDYIPITIDYYYFDLDVTNECVINWKL